MWFLTVRGTNGSAGAQICGRNSRVRDVTGSEGGLQTQPWALGRAEEAVGTPHGTGAQSGAFRMLSTSSGVLRVGQAPPEVFGNSMSSAI